MLFVGMIQSGCFGSFSLTKTAYDLVDGIGERDMAGGVIRSVIMWIGFILPIYGLCLFVDVVILNLIEFWTGSNPLAMEAGEMEQQLVHYQGEEYLITATKNQFKFEKMENGVAVDEQILQYCEEDMAWNHVKDGESRVFLAIQGARANGDVTIDVYGEGGTVETATVNMLRLKSRI